MEKEMPVSLYKYKPLNEFTEKLLFEGDLYLPSIYQLNDPFEGSIPYVFDPKELTTENIFQFMMDLVKRGHQDWTEVQKYEYVTNEISKGLLFNKEHIKQQNKETQEEVEKLFGILSLTTKKNNFLMWSHYADSHQGICIGFDTKKIFEAVKGTLSPVSYDINLPIRHLTTKVEIFLNSLLFTKSKDWEYEDEYRMIKIYGARKTFKIPLDAITEVTFGCKTPLKDKERLMKKINQKNPICKIYEASLSETKFQLDITGV